MTTDSVGLFNSHLRLNYLTEFLKENYKSIIITGQNV